MTTTMRQAHPTLREIVRTVARKSAEDQWPLRKAMVELLACLEEYDPTMADAFEEILIMTQANEEEADAREALREQAEEWEGRNNG